MCIRYNIPNAFIDINMTENIKFISGYLIGFVVIMILIPWGLFQLSQLDSYITQHELFCSDYIRYIISFCLFITGAYFGITSNLYLINEGKGGPVELFGVSISPKTKKLVTSGPYKHSRNPMLLGAFSLYLSWVVFLNSFTGLVGVLLFLVIMIVFIKKSEEKRLIKDFGEEYEKYRKEVPMILPRFKIKK